MSIQDIIIKIKGWVGEKNLLKIRLFYTIGSLALTLVGLLITSYKIGQQSAASKKADISPTITIEYPPYVAEATMIKENMARIPQKAPAEAVQQTQTNLGTGNYVTAKTGKVYYPKDCSGVNRIKPENRVYFNSKEELHARGFTLAKACD